MLFNDCDHVDKVLAFLLIVGKTEQVAVMTERKKREKERGCLETH